MESFYPEALSESDYPLVSKFYERILESPKIVSAKLAVSMTELVMCENGIHEVSRSTHGTINSTIFKMAKLYSPDLAKVVLTGDEAYLYPVAKLFPSHLTEWLLAAVEFAFQHELELSWVAEEIKARAFRLLYQRYGLEYIQILDLVMRKARPQKHMDWNRNIYEMVDVIADTTHFEAGPGEMPVFPRKLEDHLLDVLFGSNRGLWSVKDVTPVRKQFTIEPKKEMHVRKGLITIALITMMNAKQRKDPSKPNETSAA